MKRYAILKYILSTVLCVSCFLTTFTSVSATDGNVLPKGDSDVITTEATEIEQLEELLLNSASKQEREAVLKKRIKWDSMKRILQTFHYLNPILKFSRETSLQLTPLKTEPY